MNRTDKYGAAKAEITDIYHENKGRYGYRRITTELRSRNILLNHKTVQRLMKELGLVCRVRMKKYHSYKGEVGKIAPNLLNRDFHAEKPNQKWVTDVTEFSLFGEKLYLSPILDLCSRDLVSYTISDRPVLNMVTTMLEKAFKEIPDGTGLILHSDQGWQYQHKQYQQMLRKKGIQQSMSRKGNCLDNAVMENFFGLLKSELLYLQEFDSIVMTVRAFHRSPLLAGDGDTRPSDLHLHFSRRFSNTDILFHAHTSVGSSNSEYGRSSR